MRLAQRRPPTKFMSTSGKKTPSFNILLVAIIVLCVAGFAGLIIGTLVAASKQQTESALPSAEVALPFDPRSASPAESYRQEIDALRPAQDNTANVSQDNSSVDLTYLLAIPSTGLLQETLPIDMTLAQSGTAEASLDTQTTDILQPGMRVYLYDHLNMPTNMVGTVENIEGTLVSINIPENYAQTYTGMTVTGKLLLYENYFAARLPAQVLINPQQETAYVWQAEPAGQGLFKVSKLAMPGTRIIEGFIEVTTDLPHPVILTPDHLLEEGLVVRATVENFDLPPADPVQQAQADDAARMSLALITRIDNTPQNSGTQSGASCSPPPANMDLYGPPPPATCPSCAAADTPKT